MKDVAEFLRVLGFEIGRQTIFDGMPIQGGNFYKEEDYKFYTGVEVIFYIRDDVLAVETRTSIWRTKWDSDFHNFTIRQLNKRFGGTFISDYGKGRYLKYNGDIHLPAESGCRRAYFNLHNEFSTSRSYLNFLKSLEVDERRPSHQLLYMQMPELNPLVLSVNLFLPFLVSILEEYFKSTYIALLKYSPRKTYIFKNSRIYPDDLVGISAGEISLESAVAKSMSFQNIGKVCSYLRELDVSLDMASTLRKPYRRRKENLFDTLNRVLEQRHELVHRNKINGQYNVELAIKDLETVEVALQCFYDHLIDHYKWHKRDL